MKLSHTLLICACLVFAGMNFSNAVTPAPVPQQQVQKWEYFQHVKTLKTGEDTDRSAFYGDGDLAPYTSGDWLKKAGDDGWELVQVVWDRLEGHPRNGDLVYTITFYLKRPKN